MIVQMCLMSEKGLQITLSLKLYAVSSLPIDHDTSILPKCSGSTTDSVLHKSSTVSMLNI